MLLVCISFTAKMMAIGEVGGRIREKPEDLENKHL